MVPSGTARQGFVVKRTKRQDSSLRQHPRLIWKHEHQPQPNRSVALRLDETSSSRLLGETGVVASRSPNLAGYTSVQNHAIISLFRGSSIGTHCSGGSCLPGFSLEAVPTQRRWYCTKRARPAMHRRPSVSFTKSCVTFEFSTQLVVQATPFKSRWN